MHVQTQLKTSDLMRLSPKGIEPKFKTVEEFMAWHDQEAIKYSKQIDNQNNQARLEKILGRSGIQKLHMNCGFKNYVIESKEQQNAFDKALGYYQNFGNGFGGFVFSGNVGTGKNHLATAIARGLIKKGKSVAIITVAELSQRFRATFDKNSQVKEAELFKHFVEMDLLILDEIGVQKTSNNDFELNLLNQIIDMRQLDLKPTGMLTNLTHGEMTSLLGPRIMDRQSNGGMWVAFNWESFRKRKGGQA